MKYIYFWALMLIICLNSCLEDKTNLEYNQVVLPDSVFVTNVTSGKRIPCRFDKTYNQQFQVQGGEELKLDVEVFYQGTDELTYEWRFGDEDQRVISTEKNLRYICTKTGNLMLMIYRKNGGSATCALFTIIVASPFSLGTIILGEDESGVCLNFVQTTREYGVPVDVGGQITKITYYTFKEHNYDLYTSYNNGNTLNMQEPVKLARYTGYTPTLNRVYGLQLLDRQWQNSVTLNGETMQKITEMGNEFIGTPDNNFKVKDFIPIGMNNFLVGESGKIYTRVNYDLGIPCTGKYSNVPLAYNDPYDIPDKGPVDINATQVMQLPSSSYAPAALIYEKENKRFLISSAPYNEAFNGANLEYIFLSDFSSPRITANESMPNYTNLNNVDKEFVTMIGPTSGNAGTYICLLLFKNGNNYYLQNNTFIISTFTQPYTFTYSASSCITLPSNISALLANTGGFEYKNNVIYFTSGNALYSMTLTGQDLQTIYTFEQPDKITLLRLMSPWVSSAGSIANRIYSGRVFSVAFENGDFKMVQLYEDPNTGKTERRFLVDKHYSKGVKDILYYEY